MKILLSIIIGIVFGLSFCYPNYVSAHLIPGFSIQPDQNYADPVTHHLYTKEGHPHIAITQDYEFTLPMTLKSENGSLMTSYLFLVTNGTDFTSEIILPEISIRVVPDHFIIHDGIDQKFTIVIKAGKNAPSGVYEPNLVTMWDNNVTKSRDVMPIPFQVGKWNWDSLSRQMESGISAKNVVCKSNHHIVVIKSEDGSPACVKPDTATKLVERGWGMTVIPNSPQKQFSTILPSQSKRITGLENDTGIVTLGNQTYYFETPNYNDTAFYNPVKISFHDVVFTLFPSGFKGGLPTDFGGVAANGCSGSYFWTDAKFPDGTHVLLNIFALTTMSQQCSALPTHTYFSTHTNPQAGLTFYDGKMKLLVSTDNQTIEKKFSIMSSQVAKQSKTVDATALQCENEFKPKKSKHVTFPNGTSLTTNYVPVFLMKPNSTGKICITNNIASQSTDQSFISAKTTSGVSKEDSETSDVIVVPYPESIVIDNTTKTIVYTITTSNDANGFYRISTTFDFCGSGIPLAVGYNSSHLFDNDFPWLGQTMPCPFNSFQSVQTQITGLSGIDVEYITKVYS